MPILSSRAERYAALAVTPDGKRAVCGLCDTMKLRELGSARIRNVELGCGGWDRGRWITALAVTPDGRYAFYGLESGISGVVGFVLLQEGLYAKRSCPPSQCSDNDERRQFRFFGFGRQDREGLGIGLKSRAAHSEGPLGWSHCYCGLAGQPPSSVSVA